jgi:hypothetical protein
MNEAAIRKQIWAAAKESTEVVESAKKGILLQPGTLPFYEALLRRVEELMKPRRTRKPKADPTTDESRRRYREAKYSYESDRFKPWVQDGHFIEPDYPNCGESNGLQEFILYYCKWMGWRATRINVMGRKIGDTWIPSATKRGSADVSATIFGRSVMMEVKIKGDRVSDAQLKEQERERKAGGIYEFISSAEDFFSLIDSIVKKDLFS